MSGTLKFVCDCVVPDNLPGGVRRLAGRGHGMARRAPRVLRCRALYGWSEAPAGLVNQRLQIVQLGVSA